MFESTNLIIIFFIVGLALYSLYLYLTINFNSFLFSQVLDVRNVVYSFKVFEIREINRDFSFVSSIDSVRIRLANSDIEYHNLKVGNFFVMHRDGSITVLTKLED